MYLNCKSFFSFRYGTFSTVELVDAAVDHGITTLTITNINNTCNCWEFVKCCNEKGIKPVVGAEVRNDDQLLYILLAADNFGLANINAFLTRHLVEKLPFPLRPAAEATSHCYIIYPLGAYEPAELKANERIGLLPCK